MVISDAVDKQLDSNGPKNRLEYSEILFRAYELAATMSSRLTTGLSTVLVDYIVESKSVEILGEIKKRAPRLIGSGPIDTYDRETRELQALLGTPSGNMVARMAAGFPNALGRKKIVSVCVPFTTEVPIIFWNLKTERVPASLKSQTEETSKEVLGWC